MDPTRSLRPRLEPSRVTLALAVGDLFVIGAFVVAGELQHGYGPFQYPGRVVGTLLPYLIGWTVAAVPAGLYAPGVTASARQTVLRTAAAWIVAVAVQQGLRATALFHGRAALTFALVSLFVGGALVVGWRGIAAHFGIADSRDPASPRTARDAGR